jgi:SAM-dependent methyltransferase
MPPPTLRVTPDDPEYQRAAREESAFWDKPQLFSAEACERAPREAPLQAYTNERLTGHRARTWPEVVATYRRFERALFFGCSALTYERAILRAQPHLSATFIDISPASLARRDDELGAEFPGRVTTVVADLNFESLPAQRYDLIVSSGTLHHLLNIEHVAYQLNNALTTDGVLFVQDYVGEHKLLFRPEKRALYEAFLQRGVTARDIPRSTYVDWPETSGAPFSPFEAIRSEDTLAVLARELVEVSVRAVGALTMLLVFTKAGADDAGRYEPFGEYPWRRHPYSLRRRLRVAFGRDRRPAMSRRFIDELCFLDALMTDSRLLLPGNAFAIYRKRR